MFKHIFTTAQAPFDRLVEKFFSFSLGIDPMARSADVPEAILEEVVASSKIRSGPCPNQESLSVMRKIIALFVRQGKPIPFIVPWGPKKPADDASVDIAEYGGLQSLLCLNERIMGIYEPGISVRIRVEDLCGFYILRESGPGVRTCISRYVDDFEELVKVLDPERRLVPVRESSLVDENVYAEVSDGLMPYFFDYITATDLVGREKHEEHSSWRILHDKGWQGEILPEQREYYRSRYRVVYPGFTEEKYTQMLAQYLAYSMTRTILGTYGADADWAGQFLQINFTAPVPGVPKQVAERKVNYRVFQSSVTRDRTPPWKARGFLRIFDDMITPSIASWSEPIGERHSARTILENQVGGTAQLKTDYVIG